MPYKDKDKQRIAARESARRGHLRNRLEAIEILGGKCFKCPQDDFRCLQIDHITPEFRDYKVNSGSRNARNVVLGVLTINDVQLLCANCHAIKTYELDRKLFKNYIK